MLLNLAVPSDVWQMLSLSKHLQSRAGKTIRSIFFFPFPWKSGAWSPNLKYIPSLKGPSESRKAAAFGGDHKDLQSITWILNMARAFSRSQASHGGARRTIKSANPSLFPWLQPGPLRVKKELVSTHVFLSSFLFFLPTYCLPCFSQRRGLEYIK